MENQKAFEHRETAEHTIDHILTEIENRVFSVVDEWGWLLDSNALYPASIIRRHDKLRAQLAEEVEGLVIAARSVLQLEGLTPRQVKEDDESVQLFRDEVKKRFDSVFSFVQAAQEADSDQVRDVLYREANSIFDCALPAPRKGFGYPEYEADYERVRNLIPDEYKVHVPF